MSDIQRTTTDALLLVAGEALAASDAPLYEQLAGALKAQLGVVVAVGSLAGNAPLAAGLEALIVAGAKRVVALPLWFGAAEGERTELSAALRWARQRWPAVRFALGGEIAPLVQVAGLLAQRARAALGSAAHTVPPEDTALLVVGRGSEHAERNAEWALLARLVWEGRPYGWAEYAFGDVAAPDVAEGAQRCERLGARRVVVLPATLLSDQAATDVQQQAQAAAAMVSAEVVVAQPLSSVVGVAAMLAQRYTEALQRLHSHSDDGLLGTHTHAQWERTGALDALLPPRYNGNAAISAAPMGAADLRYDATGQVAWNDIWTDFCDLALAGGPPHRGTLLEPPTPEAVAADPAGYTRALDELERGLRLVSGLPVLRDGAPGWIGLRCDSEDMALWLLRAIVVENVCVRREDTTLFLPAGPAFRLEHEIKNVVTVVAKTCHYWIEHRQVLETTP